MKNLAWTYYDPDWVEKAQGTHDSESSVVMKYNIRKLQAALVFAGMTKVAVDGVLGPMTIGSVNALLGTAFSKQYILDNIAVITSRVDTRARGTTPVPSDNGEAPDTDAPDDDSGPSADDTGSGEPPPPSDKPWYKKHWKLLAIGGAVVAAGGVFLATREGSGLGGGLGSTLIIKGIPKQAKREAARRGVSVRNCVAISGNQTRCDSSHADYDKLVRWFTSGSRKPKAGRGFVPGTLLHFGK